MLVEHSCFASASGGRLAVMTQTPGSSIAHAAPTTSGSHVHAGHAGGVGGAILRWVYVLACLFAIGPVVLRVVARIHDAHGGHAATLLTDGAAGFVALGTVLAVCLVVGVIGARVFTLGVGAMGAGVVAAWGAWGCAPIDTIVRATSNASAFVPLAIEGLICGVAGAAMVLVFERVAMKSQPAGAEDQMAARTGGKKSKRALGGIIVMDRSAAMATVLGAALVAAIVAAGLGTWMVATSALKGQVVAAAIAAGIAAGMASVYASQSVKGVTSGLVPALGVAIVAAAGPLLALVIDDKNLVEAGIKGSLTALARPIGLDWLAGILCGVPLGMSWAGLKLDVRALPQGAGIESDGVHAPQGTGVGVAASKSA